MANPQKESGYTAIANEIMDALCRTRIRGEARQVLDTIFRNTYGWNRKEAKLSAGFIAKATGINRISVVHNLKFLKDMNIIGSAKNPTSYVNILYINKDFSKWKLVPKKLPSANNPTTLVPITLLVTSVKNPTQQNKDSKTKSNKSTPSPTAGYVDEVNLIFNPFYETINPNIVFSRKDSRDAAAWLIKTYGFQNTFKAAKYACLIFEEKYAPSIKTPAELKDKWANLVKYKNQQDKVQET